MAVEAPERKPWQDALRDTYLECWADSYGKSLIKEGARLLPAFAVLAVAMFYHERECHGPQPLRQLSAVFSEIAPPAAQGAATHKIGYVRMT